MHLLVTHSFGVECTIISRISQWLKSSIGGRVGGQYYDYGFKVDLSTACEVASELERLTLPNSLSDRI